MSIEELLRNPNNQNLAKAIEILHDIVKNVRPTELPDLSSIEGSIEELKKNYNWLSSHVTKIMGEDLEALRKDIGAIRRDLVEVLNTINDIKERLSKLESKVNGLTKWKSKVARLLSGE
mgnify:CR=1 FL=1